MRAAILELEAGALLDCKPLKFWFFQAKTEVRL
jgi:hypothetical protein